MANPEKGEVEFSVGEKTYTLCLGTNAIVEVERLLDSDISAIVGGLNASPRMETLRAVLYGALRKFQPTMTLIDVGDLLDEIGTSGLADMGAKLGEAVRFRLSGA